MSWPTALSWPNGMSWPIGMFVIGGWRAMAGCDGLAAGSRGKASKPTHKASTPAQAVMAGWSSQAKALGTLPRQPIGPGGLYAAPGSMVDGL